MKVYRKIDISKFLIAKHVTDGIFSFYHYQGTIDGYLYPTSLEFDRGEIIEIYEFDKPPTKEECAKIDGYGEVCIAGWQGDRCYRWVAE